MSASTRPLAVHLLTLLVLSWSSAADAQTVLNQTKATNGLGGCDAPGFPLTLCKRGSYKLTGNLTVPNGNTTAIEITNDNVTLDLNGFGIFGPGVVGGGSGIVAVQSNVTVMNGSVRGMGLDGVWLGGNAHRVDNVYATQNGSNGIHVGASSLVRGSTALLNGTGILAELGSSITGNTTNSNWTGIVVYAGSHVTGNTAYGNTSYGLVIYSSVGVSYAHNSFTANNGAGPQVAGDGVQTGGNGCNGIPCP